MLNIKQAYCLLITLILSIPTVQAQAQNQTAKNNLERSEASLVVDKEIGQLMTIDPNKYSATNQTHADKNIYIARDETINNVFRSISSQLKQPIILSKLARRYKISGEFNLTQAMQVIEKITLELGLIWYFDGRVVYIYDNSEAKSIMLSMPSGTYNDVVSFLKKAALFDKKYPLSVAANGRALYLSGPPKYVEIVSSAINMFKNRQEQQSQNPSSNGTDRQIELIKLKHASVNDRQYTIRGENVRIPGIANVLQQIFSSSTIIDVINRPNYQNNLATPTNRVNPSLLAEVLKGNDSNSYENLDRSANLELAKPDFLGNESQKSVLPLQQIALTDQSQLAPKLRIMPYSDTNSLLLEGSATQIAGVKKIIESLDVPKQQIELSLWIIDIDKGDADKIGAGLSGQINFGSKFGLNMELGSGSRISKADTTRFIAEISALSSENRAQIVSRPILLTQDNTPAIFDNSHTYYIKLQGYRTNSLEKVTYGTLINVLPRVTSDNGRIEMSLDIEDGSRGTAERSQGIDMPPVSNTKISTVARVMHDQSLLIGGYTLNRESGGVSKVPLLGDIPLIGNLFKYRISDNKKLVRMFLIQPKVLVEDAPFEGLDHLLVHPEIDNAVDALRSRLENKNANKQSF